ncbi:hypothetical protein DFH06DRAFT_1149895 [Mycena polygramma]|nr:hypothetical protein DFH06DRAFT_1149895 [Mycena polygramma]
MRADSQLISSIVLGSLSLIPNNPLRYVALASTVAVTLLYHLHLRPTAFLHHLAQSIKQTEGIFEQAISNDMCPRDRFSLAAELKRSVSEMQCHLWAKGNKSWKQYWHLHRSVVECVNSVENIRIAAQLVLEAEIQRKIAQDITETHIILANAPSACAVCHVAPVNQTNSCNQFVCGYK